MKVSSFFLSAGRFGLIGMLLFISAGVVLSQEKAEKGDKAAVKAGLETSRRFCSNTWSMGDKASANEVRNLSMPSSGSLNIDGGRNGGIKVIGEDRSDIAIKACVQAYADSEDAARAIVAGVTINTAGGVVKAEGPDRNWSVSYEARVPKNINLKLNAHNGGIGISSVDGRLEFETMNGGVTLRDVAGDVRGKTTNGGVHVWLSGNTWKGTGLDVSTTNGGVNLTVPQGYAANIESGTVNGGFKSDIPELNVTTEDVKGWQKSKEIRTAINGGGAPIRITTRNGGVKIGTYER